MKTDIKTITREDTIAEAARRMRDAHIGFLPVVDTRMKPIGVVTDRDIVVRGVASELSAFAIIGDVMSERAFCVNAGDDIDQAEQLMRDESIGRAMCVDDAGTLVGVISLSDLAMVESSEATVDTANAVTARRDAPLYMEDEGSLEQQR